MIVPIVIHVVVSLDHGGLERLVVDWTNERNRRHHAVSLTSSGWTSICCLDKPGDLAGEVNGDVVVCVNAKRGRKPFDIAAVLRLRLLIRGRKTEDGGPGAETRDLESSQEGLRSTVYGLWSAPIVVHSHNLAAWQYAALACMGMGVRHIHTEHGTNPHSQGLVNQWRTRWLVKRTDQLVAVSENTASALVEEHGALREAIQVVRNGVAMKGHEDAQEAQKGDVTSKGVEPRIHTNSHEWGDAANGDVGVIRSAGAQANSAHAVFDGEGNRKETTDHGLQTDLRASLGIPDDAVVIGSVGRLAQVKGYDRLIGVFSELVNTVSDMEVGSLSSVVCRRLRLLLIGDGPERANLEVQVKELGVSDRVIFSGYRSDAKSCLAAMDLFVLPSRSEGLSVSLLEAMAAEVPVAVTDVGESRRVIENGECGVLLPDDEAEWSNTLHSVMCDLRCAMCVERTMLARQRMKQHYSMYATLDEYEKLYAGEIDE